MIKLKLKLNFKVKVNYALFKIASEMISYHLYLELQVLYDIANIV